MPTTRRKTQIEPRTDADWLGSWWPIAEAMGEFPYILFGRMSPRRAEPEWQLLHHEKYDGIGAFAELLRREGIELGEVPKMLSADRPTRLKQLVAAIRFAATGWRHTRWRQFDYAKRGRPVAAAWYACSQDETKALRSTAKALGTTFNAF